MAPSGDHLPEVTDRIGIISITYQSKRKTETNSERYAYQIRCFCVRLFSKTSPETSPEHLKRVQKRVQKLDVLNFEYVHLVQLIG